jgi:hypothetical protein
MAKGVAMASLRTATAADLRSAIDDLYVLSDEVLDSLTESGWHRGHGRDWVMSDVPYHLAYFEREIVIPGLERGALMPADAQLLLSTTSELDAWNARMFARRPDVLSGPDALDELRVVRARVRQLAGRMSDDDLESAAWSPIGAVGWRDKRYLLAQAIMHNWSEHMQLLIRLGQGGPEPEAETTHFALDGFMRHFPMLMTRPTVESLRVRIQIEGPGGGAWVLHAHDFACDVSEDASGSVDLALSMTPRTWARMWGRLANPNLLILSQQIRVRGFSRLGAFNRVFGPPPANAPLTASLVAL